MPSEPKPGEPLSPEAERILSGVPNSIGDESGEQEVDGSAGASENADALAGLMPEIDFDPREVQDVLEEAFDWMADRFDSAHWKLTERQSRMLGKPTAQLLSSLYMKLSNYLPIILADWCDSTPGLMAFILASGVVVGPKIAQQYAVSRERRRMGPKKVQSASARPQTVPPRPQNGPVGVGPIEPIAEILDQ